MLSAMYENGGNTTHRLLDGHPELFTYPFESQLGTKYCLDYLSSIFPYKYRWPVFPSHLNPTQIYYSIKDEETKIRAITPFVSKFKNADFNFSDKERKKIFISILKKQKNNFRSDIIYAFFTSTFQAWKNYHKSGQEKYFVGYSPIICIDGEIIIKDFDNNAYILHIIRNPFSAYAETKKRPVPLSLNHYIFAWNTCQYYALLNQKKYPKNFFVLRYEDIIKNPEKVLTNFLKKLALKKSKTLSYPSWNGKKLKQIYPWGTIKIPTPKVNLETAKTLSSSEISKIFSRTQNYLEKFTYQNIYQTIKN